MNYNNEPDIYKKGSVLFRDVSNVVLPELHPFTPPSIIFPQSQISNTISVRTRRTRNHTKSRRSRFFQDLRGKRDFQDASGEGQEEEGQSEDHCAAPEYSRG